MDPAAGGIVNAEKEVKGTLQLPLLFVVPIAEYRLFPDAAKMFTLLELATPAIAVILGFVPVVTLQPKGVEVESTFVTTLTVPELVPMTRPGVRVEPLRNVPNAVTPPLVPLADVVDDVQSVRPDVAVMAKQSAGFGELPVWSDPFCPFGRGVGVLEVLLLPEQAERVTRSARKRAEIFRERWLSGFSFKQTVFMGRHPRFVSVDCCFGSLPEPFHRVSVFRNIPRFLVRFFPDRSGLYWSPGFTGRTS